MPQEWRASSSGLSSPHSSNGSGAQKPGPSAVAPARPGCCSRSPLAVITAQDASWPGSLPESQNRGLGPFPQFNTPDKTSGSCSVPGAALGPGGGEEYLQIPALEGSPCGGGGIQQTMEHDWFHLGRQGRLLSRMIPEDGQELSLQPSLPGEFKPGGTPFLFQLPKSRYQHPHPQQEPSSAFKRGSPRKRQVRCSLRAVPSPHL